MEQVRSRANLFHCSYLSTKEDTSHFLPEQR